MEGNHPPSAKDIIGTLQKTNTSNATFLFGLAEFMGFGTSKDQESGPNWIQAGKTSDAGKLFTALTKGSNTTPGASHAFILLCLCHGLFGMPQDRRAKVLLKVLARKGSASARACLPFTAVKPTVVGIETVNSL